MQSVSTKSVRSNEIICRHIMIKKRFAFRFDQKESVRFICKNILLSKHCRLSGPVSRGRRLVKDIIKAETFNETEIVL